MTLIDYNTKYVFAAIIIAVSEALERGMVMHLLEWCQSIQIHADYTKKYS